MLVGCRALAGDMAPLEVGFKHAAPRDIEAHRRFFRASRVWHAELDYLELPLALLGRAPVAANEALAQSFAREAERRLESAGELDLVRRVQIEIERALLSGAAEAAAVARSVGVSERSLRRALAERGVSFRGLLEQTRKARALELLQHAGASVTDAAFLLGFSETSAFSRAFRRWFGVSPRGLPRAEPACAAGRALPKGS